ncbi:MAG TPA: hypothetical protein VL547_07510 [Dinghuibacter sp.]|jgi:hypothetical protein|uniref:hypothetical protein n=1 Tax=Dinghuibacter sp. TaxID=2024697 RepID=UPI002D0265C7|nr:hypothetical protein [Dinghuibacter sp.]HTJ11854.1 hypothetical protein [Dinghuibacter sp.]
MTFARLLQTLLLAVASTAGRPAADTGWKPSGDNPWQELDRLSAAVLDRLPLRMSGTIRLVDDKNGRVIEQQPFSVDWIDTLDSRYRIGDMEVQRTARLQVTVDHQGRTVQVDKAAKAFPGMNAGLWRWRVWMQTHKVQLQVLTDGHGRYQLLAPGGAAGQVSDIRLYYDHDTWQVSKAVWYDLQLGKAPGDYTVNRVEFCYDSLSRIPSPGILPDYQRYLEQGYHLR